MIFSSANGPITAPNGNNKINTEPKDNLRNNN